MVLDASPARFYLTGRLCIEGSAGVVDQPALPGRHGRLALVRLVSARLRPVPVDELAASLWGDDLPPSWQTSLRAVLSKLRGCLAAAGADLGLDADAGCYQARLGDAWVDLEAAANAVDRAEGARRSGDLAAAWSHAAVASAITRRPLLPGEDLPWVAALQGELRSWRVRALDVLADVHLAGGDAAQARAVAEELVALEPYREAGHRHLMRAHVAAGDRAEAVRVHDRLRRQLAEELGVGPAPETAALLTEVLRAGG
ncbi:MAG: BTAD domain-containing putative transcriptional regulator [Actinomycetes bacterium]